ncbi:MAG: hypothetical protein K2L82_04345 [Lachnospiraceae bacterium]|nr:hypothetical protein [Lachnospiraceae bacterium]
MTRIVFVLIVFLLFVWRMKRGFHNGMMKEVVTLLSGAVSLVCVALIFFAVSSVMAKAMSTLTVCVVSLVLLGIAFKLCSLIFSPLLALSNISIIGGVDKALGGVMGAAEALVLSCLIFFALDYIGIYIV